MKQLSGPLIKQLGAALLASMLVAVQAPAAELNASAQGAGLQTTLNNAQCGDIIRLNPGIYHENIATLRHCSAEQPITIIGPRTAVVTGSGGQRIVDIRHDHHHLIGFTIDGLQGNADSKAAYGDKLVYAKGSPQHNLEGLKILDMALANAGSECVRLRMYIMLKLPVPILTIAACTIFGSTPGGITAKACISVPHQARNRMPRMLISPVLTGSTTILSTPAATNASKLKKVVK